jgi:formamidopyrimidine-DNA glycosylase
LKGHRITALRRRGQYLLAELDDGTTLLMHLGMSGSFRIEAPGEKDAKPVADDAVCYRRGKLEAHDHVVFHLKATCASSTTTRAASASCC